MAISTRILRTGDVPFLSRALVFPLPGTAMNEKTLFIIIMSILGLGFLGVSWMAVQWMMLRGFANWRETLVNDLLILVVLVFFVYTFSMINKT